MKTIFLGTCTKCKYVCTLDRVSQGYVVDEKEMTPIQDVGFLKLLIYSIRGRYVLEERGICSACGNFGRKRSISIGAFTKFGAFLYLFEAVALSTILLQFPNLDWFRAIVFGLMGAIPLHFLIEKFSQLYFRFLTPEQSAKFNQLANCPHCHCNDVLVPPVNNPIVCPSCLEESLHFGANSTNEPFCDSKKETL